MQTKLIYVSFVMPGIHCYPDAPDDVSYLRSPHRHLFHFKIGIEVYHNDRDIEYHQFMNFVKSHFKSGDYDNKSCEMLCEYVLNCIKPLLPSGKGTERRYDIEVGEDGECWSRLTNLY